jgi:hypothetical protein
MIYCKFLKMLELILLEISEIYLIHKLNHQITEIENGTYLNLGIVFIIKPHLENILQLLPCNTTLKLSFNIDGIPLAKNSKTQFWPILLSILNIPILLNTIFPVGIFHSFSGKPKDLNQFLKPF